jgi:DNA-binding transcriptional LysR family regulator
VPPPVFFATAEAAVQFRQSHLRYFVAVADAGQITRAANALHIAQPALSQAIANLEQELGFQLLVRHARGVTVTPAGASFLEKARRALDAQEEAERTARSLVRGLNNILEWGFVVAPPGLHSPGPLRALARAHPDIEIRYQELAFPSTPTHAWLWDVDLAVCHRPPADPGVWQRRIAREPRVVLAAKSHPLAAREELTVTEVLDETFIGFHPATDPEWAGFWSLDDHRGMPPRNVTVDRAINGQEIIASLAVRNAITTAPASVAHVATSADKGIVMIPLIDASPADVVLAGSEDRRNPMVDTVVEFMLGLGTGWYGAPSPG